MIEVLKPGLLTTIQDIGREGFQQFGVSVSGSIDPLAHKVANLLAGNDIDSALQDLTCVSTGRPSSPFAVPISPRPSTGSNSRSGSRLK